MNPFLQLFIYNLITLGLTVVLLVLCKRLIKSDKTKDLVLKITSILVIIIHFSSLYVDFFINNGEAVIEDSMLLPIYPCNIIMWLLLIIAFYKNKESKIYKWLSEFSFIGGTFCGLIGVLFNINFLNNPQFSDYYILKGLISHNIMIFATLFLGVFRYVKIEVKRTTFSIIFGLLIFVILGVIINTLYAIFNIPSVNAMFMLEPPLKDFPIFNFFTIGILAVLVSFIALNVYELFTFKKEDRWLYKIKNKKGE